MRAVEVDPNLDYVARRHMTIGGISYERGDTVPREVIPEKKYDTWVANRVLVRPMGAESLRRDTGQTVPKGMQEANGAGGSRVGNGGEPEREAVDDLPADDEHGYIVHVGRGWFNVCHGGDAQKIRGADAAANKLRELRGTSPMIEPDAARAIQGCDLPPVTNTALLDDPREPPVDAGSDDDAGGEAVDPKTGEIMSGGAI